jgi:deazaflavin-dependent oxidoreductase (nitroreductase family)
VPDKRAVVTWFEKYLVNPYMKRLSGFVGPVLLETTGRRTGKPRRTPLGAKLEDGSYWILTEHGHRSDYVRNIKANPVVRIKRHGRWHTGTARIVSDEEAARHTRGSNAAVVRLLGTELLVVRIDPTS